MSKFLLEDAVAVAVAFASGRYDDTVAVDAAFVTVKNEEGGESVVLCA